MTLTTPIPSLKRRGTENNNTAHNLYMNEQQKQQNQPQSPAGTSRMVEPSTRRGPKIALVVVAIIALIFLALAALFWMRSSADQARVADLEEIVSELEGQLADVGDRDEGKMEERDPLEKTYIGSFVEENWGAGLCEYVHKRIEIDELPEGYWESAGLTAAALADEAVLGAMMPELVTDAGWEEVYIDRILGAMERNNAVLLAQCDVDGQLYVALTSGYGVLQIFEWVPDESVTRSRLDAYQPIDGMVDYAFTLFDIESLDELAVWTGYADAGYLWYEVHTLDSDTRTSDLIETCNDKPVYDEDGGSTDERVIACDREYLPDDNR